MEPINLGGISEEGKEKKDNGKGAVLLNGIILDKQRCATVIVSNQLPLKRQSKGNVKAVRNEGRREGEEGQWQGRRRSKRSTTCNYQPIQPGILYWPRVGASKTM